MKIEILVSAKEALNKDFKGKNVVVIDVLRATTVMITALKNGAEKIYPFKEIKEAIEKKEELKDGLLAGERKGLKIEGFDFGNSPLEFTEKKIKGKVICMTTSNGTRAIENSQSGDNIYIASYINVSSVVEKVLKNEKDLIIVCAGTEDEFSLDDSLCAGIIANKILEKRSVLMDDFTISLQNLAKYSKNIKEVLKDSKHYSYLKKIGYESDLDYCLTLDCCDIVPEYKNKEIKGEY
ncbi:2-phosphosulfolactate phosphatase [uncultured Cetobacterium sp.]|uniref:2-phosphosulfolactate phosphatase n=1 Tax=uncultured Cetobacterium sp. TaxID=527638 RepID=UPI00261277B4|nr:2-phosphosulfolactate phosphatase [uncultured Cetobacterium sp.]